MLGYEGRDSFVPIAIPYTLRACVCTTMFCAVHALIQLVEFSWIGSVENACRGVACREATVRVHTVIRTSLQVELLSYVVVEMMRACTSCARKAVACELDAHLSSTGCWWLHQTLEHGPSTQLARCSPDNVAISVMSCSLKAC